MKKAKVSKASSSKAEPKKLNKNNKSTLVKMKNQVKAGVKSLVKAMSAKPAKKAQTKAPAKPAKAVKAVKPAAAKSVAAKTPAAKATDKNKKVAAPAKGAVPAKAAKTAAAPKAAPAAKVTKASAKEAKVDAKASAKAAKSEAIVAAAVLKKTATGKKGKSLSAEALERMCRESNCENVATTKGYCRLDYIKNWKKIKRKEMILKEGKLNQYIEELVGKYPDKYIEVIRQDLSTEVNFNKVIHDLELDESIDDLDYDGDSIDSLIGSISKDKEGFDDDEF